MSQISSGSDLDLDIDLESGGTTSEEDVSKNQAFGYANSKRLLGRVRSGLISPESLSECTSDEDCSCSYDKFLNSDEILAMNKEQMGRCAQVGHKKGDEEKPKKQSSTKPSKPPRPPRGPLLNASDMKLLKEITELKLKRRKIERSGTLRKVKKEKASSLKTNVLACLVTVAFLVVIIFEGCSIVMP
ncbi:uncharacterized protein LOC130997509 [Salvia miltiorrhiza]|uniref:uncharacterized protein LOC130997509 n=1 Tax=Salvia miltiorrhiza TaxID=226208 RepID=UPI0025AC2F84|nr:uncharacterized protein LOC130997509 [Salvia miltiorrhiza]XP_057778827.1 uncharacterized protein LOC130997509 [Salvia miltiorrhiza]